MAVVAARSISSKFGTTEPAGSCPANRSIRTSLSRTNFTATASTAPLCVAASAQPRPLKACLEPSVQLSQLSPRRPSALRLVSLRGNVPVPPESRSSSLGAVVSPPASGAWPVDRPSVQSSSARAHHLRKYSNAQVYECQALTPHLADPCARRGSQRGHRASR